MIYTKNISKRLKLNIKMRNVQRPAVRAVKFTDARDRLLIIDEKEVYHFGARPKDLGENPVVSKVEPWFAVSKLHISSVKVLDRVKQLKIDN